MNKDIEVLGLIEKINKGSVSGPLATRGWVLKEASLSYPTIMRYIKLLVKKGLVKEVENDVKRHSAKLLELTPMGASVLNHLREAAKCG